MSCRPFIRWVGGKNLLLKNLKPLVDSIDLSANKYIEPFIGGGSLFLSGIKAQSHIINDLNSDLSFCYQLLSLDETFNSLVVELSDPKYINDKPTFVLMKSRFNELKKGNVQSIERSALFIYLNYLCFNGFYIESKRTGIYNSGFGYRTTLRWPGLCIDRLTTVRNYLSDRNTVVCNKDYSEILKVARKGDLIYLDPPYFDCNTFTSYTQKQFDTQSQIDLVDWCDRLDKLGCYIVYSNNNKQFIKDLFDKLGGKWKCTEFTVNRVVSCKINGRQNSKNELIITNF